MHHHLGMVHVTQVKTAENICDAITALLAGFSVTRGDGRSDIPVTMLTTDGASNIKTAVRVHMRRPHFVCAAHQLQRCLAMLEKIPTFKTIVRKCHVIANRFHKSSHAKRCGLRHCWCCCLCVGQSSHCDALVADNLSMPFVRVTLRPVGLSNPSPPGRLLLVPARIVRRDI